MKLTLLLAAMASVALAGVANNNNNNEAADSAFHKRVCAGNNCNRAVTGTRDGLPAATLRRADCSSFLLTTVTPYPVIKTKWIGDNSFYYDTAITTAVTSTATHKPAYATACAANAAYASACSCWGVLGRTVTAPRPTVTVTKTKASC